VRRRLVVIGVGAGDPSFVTAQAAAAIADVDVILVIDKGESCADLVGLRRSVLERFAPHGRTRTIELADTRRDADLPYERAVDDWHGARVEAIERALADDVAEGETAGILVWGDPAWFDSTLRLVERINARGAIAIDCTVIPGVSSIEVLAARHGIALNRVGRPVLVTTGRRLREDGLPPGVDDAVVLLDRGGSYTALIGQGFDIFWGAYLGMPDEILVAGALDDVAGEITAVRDAARQRKGWIFDTYLLRRRTST
jgi:precorrin-6A synthase